MKKCRFCAKDIEDAAAVCPHCGKDLTTSPATAPIEPAAAAPALVPLAAQVPTPPSPATPPPQPVEQKGGSTKTGDDDAA